MHSTFVVNHHDVPDFVAGGLQLQLWDGDILLSSHRASTQAVLATPGETITWKQRLALHDGKLVFEVTDGNSTTWGNFGGDDSLELPVSTDLTNLNTYDPQVSAANSGVSYAANRVHSLILKSVEIKYANGEVVTVDTPQTVYPKGD